MKTFCVTKEKFIESLDRVRGMAITILHSQGDVGFSVFLHAVFGTRRPRTPLTCVTSLLRYLVGDSFSDGRPVGWKAITDFWSQRPHGSVMTSRSNFVDPAPNNLAYWRDEPISLFIKVLDVWRSRAQGPVYDGNFFCPTRAQDRRSDLDMSIVRIQWHDAVDDIVLVVQDIYADTYAGIVFNEDSTFRKVRFYRSQLVAKIEDSSYVSGLCLAKTGELMNKIKKETVNI